MKHLIIEPSNNPRTIRTARPRALGKADCAGYRRTLYTTIAQEQSNFI
jgi:hypothetical protein